MGQNANERERLKNVSAVVACRMKVLLVSVPHSDGGGANAKDPSISVAKERLESLNISSQNECIF